MCADVAPGGYMMNVDGAVVDDDGAPIFGDRLDAGWVPSLDAPAPEPLEPDRGWPDGTRMIDGRPCLPHDPSRRALPSLRRPSRRPHARARLLRRAISWSGGALSPLAYGAAVRGRN